MLISVVMPVLNEEKLIQRSLEVLAGWEDLELIVVDGGSEDRTAELAAEYATVLASNPGRPQQMNHGAQHANGEILWFVHVDTTLPEDAPIYVRNAVSDGYIGGAFRTRFDETNWFWDLLTSIDNLRTRLFRIYFGSRAMFVKKDTFNQLGGFPQVAFLEDSAFSKLLRKVGPTVMVDAVALESFRRFRETGPIRQLLLDIVLLGGFNIGVSPDLLARFYKHIR